MNKFYSITFFVLIGFMSNAQTFTWVTNDTIETNLDLNTTVQHKMEQAAVGTDTVTLGVEVIYNDLPSYWDGMLCIEGLCLGVIPPVGTTATMSPISGSQYGYVRLTVNPFNGTELAKLQVYVYDVDFPNEGDTATWILNSSVSLNELDALNSISMFPNPVVNDLNIDYQGNFESVSIYSMSGELIIKEEFFTGQIDVSELQEGVYILELVSPDGNTVSKKFVKR